MVFCLGRYKKTKNSESISKQKVKGFINLQFVQKLGSQKPFREEAKLSSLVNKRFDRTSGQGSLS